MCVLNCFYAAHMYTYLHHSRRTTYTGPIIAHGTLFIYCYPAVNQTLALIVLDGFEPPALIQTRPLFKLRPLFGHIRYVCLYVCIYGKDYFSEIKELNWI